MFTSSMIIERNDAITRNRQLISARNANNNLIKSVATGDSATAGHIGRRGRPAELSLRRMLTVF